MNEMKDMDFEQELYNHFGQVKDFTLGMRIAKYFYELGKQSGSSEKPMNQEGLEEELDRFIASGKSVTVEDCGTYKVSYHDFKKVASHFAKWGAEHAKIESEKPVPKDLVEAASKFATYTLPNEVSIEFIYEKISFQEGAKWQKEQIMKGAVEVRVQSSPLNGPLGISAYCCNFPSEHPFYRCKEGDKVKVIIVKEDEK